jgi:hypothetical protein
LSVWNRFDFLLSSRLLRRRFPLPAVWVLMAMVVAYWTSFFTVLLSSADANRFLLNIAFLCLATNTGLTAYLMIYLPHVKKLKDSSAWSVYCPRVIPIMILLGVICALLLIRGTWPVWGFFAPLYLGIEAMGFLFSLHFVPWFA